MGSGTTKWPTRIFPHPNCGSIGLFEDYIRNAYKKILIITLPHDRGSVNVTYVSVFTKWYSLFPSHSNIQALNKRFIDL